MNKSTLREQLFKLLFRIEFVEKGDMPEQEELFFLLEDSPVIDETSAELIRTKADKIIEKLPEIDAGINEKITGWNTERIGKVELTILRIAVYEIENDDDVPTAVAINEAVELAKKFGPDGASGFVNGVLAKFT